MFTAAACLMQDLHKGVIREDELYALKSRQHAERMQKEQRGEAE